MSTIENFQSKKLIFDKNPKIAQIKDFAKKYVSIPICTSCFVYILDQHSTRQADHGPERAHVGAGRM